ncbi:MAG TPA: MFS transporter [Deltaproteobacteria bacterium]|nr:MFS transporter [Deltaproteobacteria bacterium]
MKRNFDESSPSYYGWLVVVSAFAATMIAYGITYSFSVFFKALYSEFGWTRAAAAGAFSAYAISHNVFAPLSGWMTDRIGPRIVAASGGLCLAGSMILMSTISSITEFYLYYVVFVAWGVAAAYTPMLATVSRWFTEKRGLAISVSASGLGAGSLVLSPLAAWLISSYGWRTAYVSVGIVAFVVFIPIVLLVRKSPEEHYGETMIIDHGTEPEQSVESAQIIHFTFIDALKTRALWTLSFSWFFAALALWTIMIHIVPLMTDRGVAFTTAGFLAGLAGGGSIIGRISAGFLSDQLGRKRILIAAFLFQAVMLLWLLFSRETWMFFLFAPLFGMSFGSWAGVIPAFPADYFGLKSTGAIFGFVMIMAGLGVALGSFLGGFIFDLTNSYNYTIIMCFLGTLLAVVSAALLKKPEKL